MCVDQTVHAQLSYKFSTLGDLTIAASTSPSSPALFCSSFSCIILHSCFDFFNSDQRMPLSDHIYSV